MKIIVPSGMFGASSHDDVLDTLLRSIAVKYGSEEEWSEKYGTNFENEKFIMHRYCWCEQVCCVWCCSLPGPDDAADDAAILVQQRTLRSLYGDWSADVRRAPNFWHKGTGLQVIWYKYIGRDVQVNMPPTLQLLSAIESDLL